MIYLKSLWRLPGEAGDEYPFSTPLLRNLTQIDFSSPVTILCGDNGCGKTTLIELIAARLHMNRVGEQEHLTDAQRRIRRAASRYRAALARKPAHHFLFTAEGFSRYVDYVVAEKQFARQELENLHGRYGSDYAESLASQPYHATLGALESLYAAPLEQQSHGQGFLDFFRSRLIPGGLYLMDEPEAALSYVNQLALIYLIQDAVKQNCQLILATHSPILAAYPSAALLEMQDGALLPRAYDELGNVQFLKHFLRAHEQILTTEY